MNVIQDVRFALRALLKHRAYAAVAILTLALGVGANTAIFSVLRAVVLRDLPYHEPDRIAVMWTKNIRQNLPDGSSYLNFRDWKEQSREFQAMAAYIRPEFTRGTLSGAARAPSASTSGSSAQASSSSWARAPLLGRTFEAGRLPATSRGRSSSPTRLWRQRFGGDRGIIGRTIQFNDTNVEVIGVMPPEFELPTSDVQVWQPLDFVGPQWLGERSRGRDALVVLGRLSDVGHIQFGAC